MQSAQTTRGRARRRLGTLSIPLAASLLLTGCGSVAPPTASTPTPSVAVATSSPSSSSTPLPISSPEGSPGQGPPGALTVDATVQAAALPPALFSVVFINTASGWAGGTGVILGTTNAGSTWRTEWMGTTSIQSLTAVDRAHVWGLGYGQLSPTADELVRTIDGGRHWTTTRLSGGFREIAFTTDQIGWAVVGGVTDTTTGPGRLEETLDGGAHWRASDLTAGLESVCFASPSLGWAASGAAVYRTTDGGRRWTQVERGLNDATNAGWLATVTCQGESAWVLSTGGGGGGSEAYLVTRTLDRGVHWGTVLAQPLSSSSTLPAIDSYAGSFAPISGTAAEFLGWCPGCGYGEWSFVRTADGGRTFIHAAIEGLTGASLGQITFADATHGWIATNAAGGSLLATSDGGRTWHRGYPSSARWPATDVAFVTASLGFGLGVVGDGRTLLRTTDGGLAWQAIAQVPADPFSFDRDPVIDFSDPVHGWVATTQGLYASVDGGLTWRRVPGAPLGGVAFSDNLHGCAGSFDTPAAMTTDGGRSWAPANATRGLVACAASLLDPSWTAPVQSFDPGNLLTIGAIVGPAHAWAYGLLDANRVGLETTTDGGSSWTAFRWPGWPDPSSSDTLRAISFVSPTDGWAFTLFGRIFATHDGGTTWLELRPH